MTTFLKYQLTVDSTPKTSQKITAASTYSNLPASIKTANKINTSYLLDSGTLASQGTKTYSLLIWIPEDACEGTTCETTVMEKGFTGRIIVHTYM